MNSIYIHNIVCIKPNNDILLTEENLHFFFFLREEENLHVDFLSKFISLATDDIIEFVDVSSKN